MLTKSLINKAVSQNLLCFDLNAKPGTLTYRMVGIMIDVARLNHGAVLTKLYIPRGIAWEADYKTCCGLTVYQIEELDINGELYKHYKEDQQASLCAGHKYLIVATGPNDAVIIGSIE